MSETITRSCGHTMEFVPNGDRYDEARRAKIMRKRCPPCAKMANEEHNAIQAKDRPTGSGKVKKGKEVKMLPPGTAVMLWITADGAWKGELLANEVKVQAETGGAMGIISKLARKWLQLTGAKLQGQVKA